MTIEKIQKKLEMKEYGIYTDIIELIVEAAFDYPEYDLVSMSIEKYLDAVKIEIGCSKLTLKQIELYLDKPRSTYDENDIWKYSSIATLYEAMELMKLKGISLDKVLKIL